MNYTQYKNHVNIIIEHDEENATLKEEMVEELIQQYQELEWTYAGHNEYVLIVWNKIWNNPEFQKQLMFVALKT